MSPTPEQEDSAGAILQLMGLQRVVAPGTTAALALLTDATKKGGIKAASQVT